MIEVTNDQVTDAIEQIVAFAGGDFIYVRPDRTHCWYAWDGKPSCLVGQVLHRLGVELGQLHEIEESGALAACRKLRETGVIDVPYQSAAALSAAQIQQDGGQTWGVALHAFRERMK